MLEGCRFRSFLVICPSLLVLPSILLASPRHPFRSSSFWWSCHPNFSRRVCTNASLQFQVETLKPGTQAITKRVMMIFFYPSDVVGD